MKSYLAKTDGMGASLFRTVERRAFPPDNTLTRPHLCLPCLSTSTGDTLPVLRLFSVKAAVAELFATAVFVYIGTGTVGIGPFAAPRRSLALTRAHSRSLTRTTVRFARSPGRHLQLPRPGWRSRGRIHQRPVELYRSHVGGHHASGRCGSLRKDPGGVDRLWHGHSHQRQLGSHRRVCVWARHHRSGLCDRPYLRWPAQPGRHLCARPRRPTSCRTGRCQHDFPNRWGNFRLGAAHGDHSRR